MCGPRGVESRECGVVGGAAVIEGLGVWVQVY